MTSVAILAQGIKKNCIRSNFCAKHPEKGHRCEQLGSRLERLGAERQNHSAQRGAREGGEGESVVLSSILEGETAKVQYCRQFGTPGGRTCRTVVDFCLPWGSQWGGLNPHGLCDTFGGVDFDVPQKCRTGRAD